MIQSPGKIIKIALMLVGMGVATSVSADNFPDIRGKWVGSYKVAFPAGHPTLADSAVDTVMELDVYKQEGNLIWITNKWRRADSETWITEYGTGSFDLDDRDELVISEEGPSEIEGVNTGTFIGEFDDGNLYLNYLGPEDGVSFSVALKRSGN